MRFLDGELILSPSDLTAFAACSHLTQLELSAARGDRDRPDRADPFVGVLSRRGEAHEAAILADYESKAARVISIECDTSSRVGLERGAAATVDAMRAGADVIYQATFLAGGWVGHADFLERVDVPSGLGTWSYEVADAKLARSVKVPAIVQLSSYSEHVARIQGRTPNHIHVLTGDGRRHTLKLAHFAAYHRALQRQLEDTVSGPAMQTYPEPVEHCAICRWSDVCRSQWRADDHLSLVAGMRRDQADHLRGVDIETMTHLASAPDETTVPGVGAAVFERLHHQADLQVRTGRRVPPLYELVEPLEAADTGPRLGFAALPSPCAGDLFVDLEGDPYAAEGGLEYLFGVTDVEDGNLRYQSFWAHDKSAEKRAFEALIDLVVERRARFPNMHVYHYAHYEPTAFKRLMGSHGTRELELDDLLRGEVFVDLFGVVRNAVRLGTESYSLKDVETLYMTRAGDSVMDAGASIVAYERYLEDGDASILEDLAAYNQADCDSLVGLRDWLERRREEAITRWGPLPRPVPPSADRSPELSDRDARLGELAARLKLGLPDDRESRTPDEQARWLLAELLFWHQREDKPAWWMHYHRCHDLDGDDFVADPECIGRLRRISDGRPEKRSLVFRYGFDPQEHKFGIDSDPVDPSREGSAGTIIGLGDDWVELKRGPSLAGVPHPEAIIPSTPFNTNVLRTAIETVAGWVAEHGIDEPGPHRAVRDLLARRPPRLHGRTHRDQLRHPDQPALETLCRLAVELDHTCLAVQGPPGSGKTFSGAHMVATLLDQGRTVGVTAHSHAVISNFLREIRRVADQRHIEIRGIQKVDHQQREPALAGVQAVSTNEAVDAAVASGTVNLVAGTQWLWARPAMATVCDTLFVDEAGQMSLANVVAASPGAHSLVLLGDPQQLAQPSQGSHPEGAAASALAHLLGDEDTIPRDLGVVLDLTYRKHPSVCCLVSEIAYDNRLQPAPGMELQSVEGWAGLGFVPVTHEGNRTRSPEEAESVANLIGSLLGRQLTNDHGDKSALTLEDVIVIAPYNAHVAELRRHLPADARVGTVDKFQGREGAVAIYSMASSSPDEAPRGMTFLYDLHRLNVAVSRARAIAIVVASPQLLRVLCCSSVQMRMANAVCRYVEYAVVQGDATLLNSLRTYPPPR